MEDDLYKWRAEANIAGWEIEIEDLIKRLAVCQEELTKAKREYNKLPPRIERGTTFGLLHPGGKGPMNG